ncbi:DUF3043 domain-containing protein [Saccharomonospora azurea]|uniref:DUF3043 domain-containing protein n=1 Tax=Saccharomonospora azurea NA-128 TaxID=882081 RepID=H8GC08_9PSEU|nr:DUF3043 domain-containing protein [Saccharomonospora azurea]EHK87345.1 hypothetical protein SZMC14600_10933 [Saccharomonospora azurea SZMC 14600]EHY90777.1 Protein of unknown function (DUF3043) [Saccharomonospora azurea NA-128]
MRFLRRSSTKEADTTDGTAESGTTVEDADSAEARRKGYTPGKGRPTPKRREAEGRRRGPVAPPPQTTREAIRRSRELRKKNPVNKEERRAAAKERRERMLAGDERYLLPRDRGPVKAYVRDLVDSRRNVLGLFMPMAIVVFITLLVPIMVVQQYATLLTTVMLLGMIIEGFLNGRRISRQVREKFPKENIRGSSIGWYAFVRASQLRKLRVPKPRVKPGDKVD